jgi:lysophospholipase L1-like esterase
MIDIYSVLVQKIELPARYFFAWKASMEGTQLLLFLTISSEMLLAFVMIQVLQMLAVLLSAPERVEPYSRRRVDGRRILIVGDSTAAGTGADSYEFSLAGRFANDFPRADIVNLGVNGSTTKGVLSQLEKVKDEYFDLIVLVTGGNDIWAFTTFWGLKKTLKSIFEITNKLSDGKTVVLLYGANGSMNAIPLIFRLFFFLRTEKIKKAFKEVTQEKNVPLVELFTDDINNPFLQNPKTYFSSDGIHPSDLGYWMWYKKMWEVFREKNIAIHDLLRQ